MTPEREALVYRDILQAVLWGSEREVVFHKLAVNDITGERAEELYQQARKERIDLLRSEALRKAVKGAVILAISLGLLFIPWFIFGFTTRLLIVLGVSGSCWGGWQLISGSVDAVIAPTRKGSAVGNLA